MKVTVPVTSSPEGDSHQEVPVYSSMSEPEGTIIVMGLTGAGKSTFVARATGSEHVQIGHGLKSKTEVVTPYSTTINGKRITFLDTPGFNDTSRSELEILDSTASWLSIAYQQNVQISGIIYLHRIVDERMSGSSMKSLRMLQALCGREAAPHITLVTTRWDQVDPLCGAEREQELVSSFWKDLVDGGARFMRFDGSSAAARHIAESVYNTGQTVLQIQREIIDERKSLKDTQAGMVVEEELRKLEANYVKTISNLKKDMRHQSNRSSEMQAAIMEQMESLTQALEEVRAQKAQMEREVQGQLQDLRRMNDQLVRRLAEQQNSRSFWEELFATITIKASTLLHRLVV